MSDEGPFLYPLLFAPVLKDYVWGGRGLETVLGRKLPAGKVAESWEIAAHADGDTQVINGPYAGLTLTEVHRRLGLDLIGRRNIWAQERGKFPLLVKLLDANERLSVQVHPSDEYALVHEGNELGKTEMWVVLHAAPGARLIVGLRTAVEPAVFRRAIEQGETADYLHSLTVRAGDFVCVPSGTVHAILEGVLIAEIQQNSNTTYRIFDWNRHPDPGERPRPLHIDKALDVIDFTRIEPTLPNPILIETSVGQRRLRLCRNRYFTVERVELSPGAVYSDDLDGQTLEIWGVLEGEIEINDVTIHAVEFCLLPADLGSFQVRAAAGAVCLRAYVEEHD
jgi:mannose-6-phosphate isomerase